MSLKGAGIGERIAANRLVRQVIDEEEVDQFLDLGSRHVAAKQDCGICPKGCHRDGLPEAEEGKGVRVDLEIPVADGIVDQPGRLAADCAAFDEL